MKFKIINAALVGLILSVSCFVNIANAALIQSDYLTYGDGLAVYDDLTDTTWLDLSETDGMGYSAAALAYSDFTHADDAQINALFSGYFVSTDYNRFGFDDSTGNTQAAAHWITVFGLTDDDTSYGFFVDDQNTYRLAGAYLNDFGFTTVAGPDYVGDWSSAQVPGNGVGGVFMTKNGRINYEGPSQVVPEPSTLAIFALGMIGLASRRFKKQS